MRKIPSLFIRDTVNSRLVTREVDPDCRWVVEGYGKATQKYDGTACLILEGRLYRRHRLKPGRPVPTGWIHWNMVDPEPTGHGWLPVTDTPADDYHREAWQNSGSTALPDGTYELVGPKFQDNAEQLDRHELWQHGGKVFHPEFIAPRTFDVIRDRLENIDVEGIVWHHRDGRMAKIKKSDFGLARR